MGRKCDYTNCVNFGTKSSECDECIRSYKYEYLADYYEESKASFGGKT